MPRPVSPIPEGYASVTPYLIVHAGAEALAWYAAAFGAKELFRMGMEDGRIGHAELQLGTSRIMLADEFPDMGARSPRTVGGSPISLMLYVEDVDAVVAKAVAAGAKVVQPVEVKFYGDRSGLLEDPFGYQWNVATHVEDIEPEELMRRAKAAHA